MCAGKPRRPSRSSCRPTPPGRPRSTTATKSPTPARSAPFAGSPATARPARTSCTTSPATLPFNASSWNAPTPPTTPLPTTSKPNQSSSAFGRSASPTARPPPRRPRSPPATCCATKTSVNEPAPPQPPPPELAPALPPRLVAHRGHAARRTHRPRVGQLSQFQPHLHPPRPTHLSPQRRLQPRRSRTGGRPLVLQSRPRRPNRRLDRLAHRRRGRLAQIRGFLLRPRDHRLGQGLRLPANPRRRHPAPSGRSRQHRLQLQHRHLANDRGHPPTPVLLRQRPHRPPHPRLSRQQHHLQRVGLR